MPAAPLLSRQRSAPIYDCAIAFADSAPAALYCPGHKGGRSLPDEFRSRLAQIDLNNLPDTDTLHCPTGPIREAEELLATAYGVDHSFLLVGGSTAGNTALLMATVSDGQEVLIQRNVHKSTIAGLVHTGACPVWLVPTWDPTFQIAHGLDNATVAAGLRKHPDARGLVVLNPTYYGSVADIEGLARLCTTAGRPILVDEAHGAHFHFHPDLPRAAESAGADAVVQSTHKMLSGLSQAAALHIRGPHFGEPQVRKMLQLIQTTSPNFAVMASIDLARRQMVLEGHERFTKVLEIARKARNQLDQIHGVRVLHSPSQPVPGTGFYGLDETKILFHVEDLGLTGHEVHRILRTQYNVQPELAGPSHVLCILTVGTLVSDVDRLVHAMREIAAQAPRNPVRNEQLVREAGQLIEQAPTVELTPRQAFYAETTRVSLSQAVGRICAEIVTPYPPGIPALVPGERITSEVASFLIRVRESGCPISASVPSLESMEVVR